MSKLQLCQKLESLGYSDSLIASYDFQWRVLNHIGDNVVSEEYEKYVGFSHVPDYNTSHENFDARYQVRYIVARYGQFYLDRNLNEIFSDLSRMLYKFIDDNSEIDYKRFLELLLLLEEKYS